MDFSQQITKAIVLLGICGATEQAIALLSDILTHAEINSYPEAKIDALRFLGEIAAQAGQIQQAFHYLEQAEWTGIHTHAHDTIAHRLKQLQLLKKRLTHLAAVRQPCIAAMF